MNLQIGSKKQLEPIDEFTRVKKGNHSSEIPFSLECRFGGSKVVKVRIGQNEHHVFLFSIVIRVKMSSKGTNFTNGELGFC